MPKQSQKQKVKRLTYYLHIFRCTVFVINIIYPKLTTNNKIDVTYDTSVRYYLTASAHSPIGEQKISHHLTLAINLDHIVFTHHNSQSHCLFVYQLLVSPHYHGYSRLNVLKFLQISRLSWFTLADLTCALVLFQVSHRKFHCVPSEGVP
jgi:hypothetical protein